MSEHLRRRGYLDGSVFHAYQAFECAISAFLVARGLPVPPSHARRLVLFDQALDASRPYAAVYAGLGTFTVEVRNRALYYDAQEDRLPPSWFDVPYVNALLPQVHRFAREIW